MNTLLFTVFGTIYYALFCSMEDSKTKSEPARKDLGKLLDNLRENLKHYSVKEINEGLVELLNKKRGNYSEVNYVFELVYSEFGVPKKVLMQKRTRNNVHEAKLLSFVLLHDQLSLSMRHIALHIFRCSPKTVVAGIKLVRDMEPVKFSNDRILLERIKRCKIRLAEFILTKNNNATNEQNIPQTGQ